MAATSACCRDNHARPRRAGHDERRRRAADATVSRAGTDTGFTRWSRWQSGPLHAPRWLRRTSRIAQQPLGSTHPARADDLVAPEEEIHRHADRRHRPPGAAGHRARGCGTPPRRRPVTRPPGPATRPHRPAPRRHPPTARPPRAPRRTARGRGASHRDRTRPGRSAADGLDGCPTCGVLPRPFTSSARGVHHV